MAMAVAVVVIADDVTALSVVLPAIEKDFHSEIGTARRRSMSARLQPVHRKTARDRAMGQVHGH
ncbi:MAG: hypothetical protein M3170_03065 [Candidatus Dormibacteraeota bacterium]|nr:hypothetical protein [Candidatus Dormibacteraeota bacterium]MDQ6920565.1 hypothetical protein [Candidatus Dormibacteraeota bacterium]